MPCTTLACHFVSCKDKRLDMSYYVQYVINYYIPHETNDHKQLLVVFKSTGM